MRIQHKIQRDLNQAIDQNRQKKILKRWHAEPRFSVPSPNLSVKQH